MGDVPRKHWNQKCNMQLIGSSQGFAAMQVDSSDEEFDALLATLGESRENQRLAWSQVASALTPQTPTWTHRLAAARQWWWLPAKTRKIAATQAHNVHQRQLQPHLWRHMPSEPSI